MTKTQGMLVMLLPLVFVAADVGATTVVGTDVYNVVGDDPFVDARDSSVVNLHAGANVAHLHAYDSSTVAAHAGSAVSHLHAYGETTINLFGGEIGFLHLLDDSSADILKSDLSWLIYEATATATVHGSNFDYHRGLLSGNWNDGTPFLFWVLREGGTISATLPSNIVLSAVPLPSSLLLLACGLLPAFRMARAGAGPVRAG